MAGNFLRTWWLPALLLAGSVPAQAAPSGPPGAVPPQAKASPRKDGKGKRKKLRWPRLPAREKRRARDWIYDLAHKDPLVVRRCEQELTALGRGVLPLLLAAMSDSQPLRNPSLERIALAVADRRDALLLAPYLGHHLVSVRRLAARLLARAGNPAALPAMRKALAKEKDPRAREDLVLALCALGDPAGLPGLFELARKDFFRRREEILAAAGKIKGEEATRWLLEKLAEKDRKSKITALRLLAAAGTSRAVSAVAPYLDAANHALALEAINTLRALVDGKRPMKHLSVFQLIQLRKEWKARVGSLGRKERKP